MSQLLGFEKYFSKELKNFYIGFTIVSIIANLADIVTIGQNLERIFIFYNLFTTFIILVSLFLFLFSKIDLKLAFLIEIIILFIHLIALNYTEILFGKDVAVSLLRQTIFAFFLLTITFLFIGKFWGLFIGIIFTTYYIFAVYLTKNNYLLSSVFYIVMLFFGYVLILGFFQKYIQKALKVIEDDSIQIHEKNEEYLATNQEYMAINDELNESQRQITAQHEELLTLSESISEQNKILEEKNIKLEEAIQQKNSLFSIIAHDLKSPISSTSALTELLLRKYDTMPEEKKKNWLNKILDSNKSIYELLENLLLWSRSQTGLIIVNPEPINLNESIETIFSMYRNTAINKVVQLINSTNSETVVVADRMMFETILRNLISNALKFSLEKGCVDVLNKTTDSEVVVIVKDSGVGMKKDSIEKLFLFQDSNVSTLGTSGEKGTGLGLRICEEFISKHNGRIWIESEVNKGTTIYFSIPIADKK